MSLPIFWKKEYQYLFVLGRKGQQNIILVYTFSIFLSKKK